MTASAATLLRAKEHCLSFLGAVLFPMRRGSNFPRIFRAPQPSLSGAPYVGWGYSQPGDCSAHLEFPDPLSARHAMGFFGPQGHVLAGRERDLPAARVRRLSSAPGLRLMERDVDDHSVRPEQEPQLQSQRRLVVQERLPEVVRHELRNDDDGLATGIHLLDG